MLCGSLSGDLDFMASLNARVVNLRLPIMPESLSNLICLSIGRMHREVWADCSNVSLPYTNVKVVAEVSLCWLANHPM